jgi:hypothetical protein
MHKKIIMFFMILIGMQVSAMEQTRDDVAVLMPESRYEQSEQEQSDALQPNLRPEEKPTCIVRPYKVGWRLTTSLVEPHQIKNTSIFQAKRAIQANNSTALKILLDSKVFDFTPQENELTSVSFALLKCAIKARSPHMCELLLQAGANPNATRIEEDEGNTILSVACRRAIGQRDFRNIYDICKILLAHGAKINKRCIVEADEERGYLLPLFVRHILSQPNGSALPDLNIKSFEGRSPIYLRNLDQLSALVEEHELADAFGGLFQSIQPGKPLFFYGLLKLFESETSHLYFPSQYFGPEHQREVEQTVSDGIKKVK